jgi:hypothetical protein
VTVLNMSSETTFSRDDALDMLGFPAGSTPTADDLKKAYRKIALKCHPDRNGGTAEATEAFQRVGAAYAFLCETPEEAKANTDLFADLIANLFAGTLSEEDVRNAFGPDCKVTVSHTSAAHASASRGGKSHTHGGKSHTHGGKSHTHGGKPHTHIGKPHTHGGKPNTHGDKPNTHGGNTIRKTCETCGKQHLGACRYAASAASDEHASAPLGGNPNGKYECNSFHKTGVCKRNNAGEPCPHRH